MSGADRDPDVTAAVSPLGEEMAALARRAGVRGPIRGRPWIAWGELAGRRVLLAVTGEGARLAAAGLEAALTAHTVARVVTFGVAGGLSPELAVGSLVASREIVEAGETWSATDPESLRLAVAAGASAGVVAGAQRVLATPGEKRRAWEALGRPSVAVVDLESAAFARVAARLGVPHLALRAVSDAADEALPLPIERFRGEDGATRRAAMLSWALARPRAWVALGRLARRAARCGRGLAETIARMEGARSGERR